MEITTKSNNSPLYFTTQTLVKKSNEPFCDEGKANILFVHDDRLENGIAYLNKTFKEIYETFQNGLVIYKIEEDEQLYEKIYFLVRAHASTCTLDFHSLDDTSVLYGCDNQNDYPNRYTIPS